MPRRNLYIAGGYSYPTRNHASREDIHAPHEIMHCRRRNSCISREIFTHRHQLHSFILIKVNIKRSIEDDIKRNVSTLNKLSFMLTSNEDYIANIRHKLYFLYVKLTELTSNIEGEQLNVNTVKDTISRLNCIFMLTSFISAFVESIGQHKKGCNTTWNFFLAANWDTVQKGVSNS